MNQSFDKDDNKGKSLPQVERPKTSRGQRKSLLSRRERMNQPPFTAQGLSSPEDISTDFTLFHDNPQTRTQKMRFKHHRNGQSAEWVNGGEEDLNVENSHPDFQKPKLRRSEAFTSENWAQEKTVNDQGRKTGQQRSSFMHLLLAESTTPEPNLSQDFLCDSGSRREICLQKRQADSEDLDGKRFSPMQVIPNHNNIVPRLNIPPDIGIEREDTLIGRTRTPGCQATPSTPEEINHSYPSSDRWRNGFGRKPNEMVDPLEDIIGSQQVSERKYSILPSIGTPIMMRKSKGQNSHRNQLDYTRDGYENDAVFFSDYNRSMNTLDVISHQNSVPLPPIQRNSLNMKNMNSFETPDENEHQRETLKHPHQR